MAFGEVEPMRFGDCSGQVGAIWVVGEGGAERKVDSQNAHEFSTARRASRFPPPSNIGLQIVRVVRSPLTETL